MIELAEIVKRYQQHDVLRGVSLSVANGEVCVLLGPSGGGKSTLLRTINGLETVDSGTIRVGDVVLTAEQGPERDAALAKVRRRVGMLEKQDARPSSLSGGQQQRVAIARTLAMNPEAILFDEPTSALDPRTTAEVIAVMTDLANAGQRMIVVTHAMSFARTVAHRIHILHAGMIAESGPPDQIFDDPQSEITRSFLAEAGRG